MKFILGKKLDMTQVWQGDKVVAVTRVQAGLCTIVQVKTDDKDGYSAVQVGYGERQKKNIKKPQLGHLKKLEVSAKGGSAPGRRSNLPAQAGKIEINLRYLREFRCGDAEKDLKIGDVIDVNTFEVGDKIQVTSTSKGKGFQGVVKRHGFHGQDKTHGTKDQLRMPGSIGATGPAHVFKGQKMPGRMGGDRVTVKGLEIVEVDKENNVLLVKGAVPGARNGLVLIQGEGDIKVRSEKEEVRSAVEGEIQKHENTKTIKHENRTAEKVEKNAENAENIKDKETSEDIEKVVVEAAEKQEKQEKQEDKSRTLK